MMLSDGERIQNLRGSCDLNKEFYKYRGRYMNQWYSCSLRPFSTDQVLGTSRAGWIDMASIRGLGEVLIIALLVILSTGFGKAHSVSTDATTPPSQLRPRYVLFHQYEVEALDVIRRNWTSQNSQFESLLVWVEDHGGRHPCNINNMNYDSTGEFEGDWVGVFCTMILRESNATGYYYEVSLTQLMLYGSNSRCGWEYSKQCGFNGIKGVLLPEIAQLISLQRLYLDNHPELTGPVPAEIWQMPNLLNVALQNNALEGPLASNTFAPASKLQGIYLYKNKFSGRLLISPNGTLFSSTLQFLNVTSNRLSGPVDLRDLNAIARGNLVHLALDDNEFNGTFSTGSALHLQNLFLSKNQFTRIQFPDYTGNGSGYMSALQTLYLDNNKLSGPLPQEFLQMPNLRNLYLGNNSFYGLVDFKATTNNLWITRIKSLDLSMNNFFGPVDFRSNYNISELIYLNIRNNRFNGTLFTNPSLNIWEIDISNNYFNNIIFNTYNGSSDQVENGYMPLLKTLCIQNNILDGEFPYQILRAPSLQVLYASHNRYKSLQLPSIPFYNSSLREILLVNNNIVSRNYPSDPGKLSPSNLEISNLLFLGGNPLCKSIENILLSTICRIDKLSPLLKVVPRLDKKYKVIVATSTSTTFGILLLVTAFYVWRLMRRIKSLHFILREFEKKEVKPNLYSYKEIKLATRYFDKKNKLGEGGFGVVYKGELLDGILVAVKKLTKATSQMLSEFLNEVVVISSCKHRNLVKLKGCCLGDGDQRMLVFEFVENKNLAEALWKQGGSENNHEDLHLDWATRLNIIVGIARGLAHLHEGLQSPIIHRDIKASNILLDKNYLPKIADFGLACLFPNLDHDISHFTTTELVGTRGYYSPEYALHGHISTALDVYSFGIVVLEIISGRKKIDSQKSSQEVDLQEWAWSQFGAQTTSSLVDPYMKHSSTELKAIVHVICIALSCVHYKATKRPKMHNVVSMLTKNMPIGEFGEGFMYGEESEYRMAEASTTISSLETKNDESSLLFKISN